MTKPGTTLHTALRIALKGIMIAAGLLALLVGSLWLDSIPLAAARPPQNLKTLGEFQAWKKDSILGRGTFAASGVTYTVMYAPAGRYLESGPSAYLFDEEGKFVDWTSDSGDYLTAKHGFRVYSGYRKVPPKP